MSDSETPSEPASSQTRRSSKKTLMAFMVVVIAIGAFWLSRPHHQAAAPHPVAVSSSTWTKLMAQDKCADSGAAIPAKIQVGDSGGCVQLLKFLIWNAQMKYGQAQIKDDGNFDDATKTAVTSFQSQNKLAASGIVDAATWTKLHGCFNPSAKSIGQIWTCQKL